MPSSVTPGPGRSFHFKVIEGYQPEMFQLKVLGQAVSMLRLMGATMSLHDGPSPA